MPYDEAGQQTYSKESVGPDVTTHGANLLLCVIHELDDNLPRVQASFVFEGTSMCKQHFDATIEEVLEARRFANELRDSIDGARAPDVPTTK